MMGQNVREGPTDVVEDSVPGCDDSEMQRCWLGDALDFWKGTFLEVLQASSQAPIGVRVLPMFTDAGWTGAEINTYAHILGVPTNALLSTAQLTKEGRGTYFSACAGLAEDIFVDPDTGVALGKPKPAHITGAEILALCTLDNVVAVYQHRPRAARADGWLTRYAAAVATGSKVLGYESAQVAMIFATRSPAREAALRQSLSTRLGAVAFARGSMPGRLI